MLYSFSSVAANLPVVATAITVSAFTARQNAMHAELDIVSPFCPPDRPPNAGTTVSKRMDIIMSIRLETVVGLPALVRLMPAFND